MNLMIVKRLVSTVLLVQLAACYAYVPAQPGGPARAAEVQVRLSQPAPFDVRDLTIQNVTRLDGEVIAWDPDVLRLSATALTSAAGQQFPGAAQTVMISRADISGLEVKRVSRFRTALAVGGVLLAAALASVIISEGEVFGDGRGGNGGNKQ